MKKLQAPNPFFLDANGDALDAGYVFVGTAGANAETNPITVYWDEAGTQPAAQPLRTSNGYIVNGVTRARAFVDADDFSMIVKNRHGVVVDSIDSQSGVIASFISPAMTPVVQAATLAQARAAMGSAQSGSNNDITSLGALVTVPTVVSDKFANMCTTVLTMAAQQTSGTVVLFDTGVKNIGSYWNSSTKFVNGPAGAFGTVTSNLELYNSSGSAVTTTITLTIAGTPRAATSVTVPAGGYAYPCVKFTGAVTGGIRVNTSTAFSATFMVTGTVLGGNSTCTNFGLVIYA